ncbi:hypothetical protein PAPYR_10061 [Paratrimastix pyriformis]|uniref:Uncharacterized protein n=1 Tax=Paratrimastix pyriformis TaxID=342808 RepID=A0ABQ8U9E6_9EUKA|nr:hypothetical protein PAPYR_10061 [Paratrimastix pyriformis]
MTMRWVAMVAAIVISGADGQCVLLRPCIIADATWVEVVNTPQAARNVLNKAGVEHYWDMLEKCKDLAMTD